MTAKCTWCIEYYQRKKREFEIIKDLKPKKRTMQHAYLKTQVCNMIREIGQNTVKPEDFPTTVETEASVEGIGKVDVVGRIGEATIAVECGNTNPEKILALKERFDIVLHIPYCYTWGLVNVDMYELEHQITVALIGKEMDRREKLRGKYVKGKAFCLREGECSLPSGRNGFPKEAMEIAGL